MEKRKKRKLATAGWGWTADRYAQLLAHEDQSVAAKHLSSFPSDMHTEGFAVMHASNIPEAANETTFSEGPPISNTSFTHGSDQDYCLMPPGTVVYGAPADVHGLMKGRHGLKNFSTAEVAKASAGIPPIPPTSKSRMSTDRLVRHVPKVDTLESSELALCRELQERRTRHARTTYNSEVKLSRYGHGDGPCHSDLTWDYDLTLAKVIMKDVGGTFFLRDDFGYWRFVELAPEEYLILPSASGARYHFAAHLKKVGEPHPVTKVQKFIAEEAEVTSLILHIGRVDRSVSGPFVEEAVAFAEGQ